MGFFVSVNGNVVPAEEARVSVLDNGFTFGDGVYETLRTYGGRPFHLDRHLARLRTSAARIGVDLPLDDRAIAARVDPVLARADNPESYIRLILTRGVGDISYHFERIQGPTLVIAVKPYDAPPESHYREGIAVAVASVRRNSPRALDPAIKSCNLLNNILAIREAHAGHASEALLLNERDELAEGASSNVFMARGGRVFTPPLDAGILPGITREVVLELAPTIGVEAQEKTLSVADLLEADEAFITSSTREIVGIRTVDGRALGRAPGPLTARLLAAFREYAPRHCE